MFIMEVKPEVQPDSLVALIMSAVSCILAADIILCRPQIKPTWPISTPIANQADGSIDGRGWLRRPSPRYAERNIGCRDSQPRRLWLAGPVNTLELSIECLRKAGSVTSLRQL
ncbi:hypothetical protein BKA67DRAFT_570894 [Truncatella angustata]|uniref:Uncharacterized protein n=1 Tax=Truncatella angustata TaxID=152316 RepID=A0A9P8UK66_9PEZI|nr:uncharacterized protein BKA67DRAFT_570894 [Truncatella angustata]KAH6653681.1 hypothetical protein BKA67DRAFT_570894 [Truncatella angustata]